jgi:hypothetical protein
MKITKDVTKCALAMAAVTGAAGTANADVAGSYAGLSIGTYKGALPFYDEDYSIGSDATFGAFAGYNMKLSDKLYSGIEVAVSNGAQTDLSGYTDDYGISLMVDVKARVGTMLSQNTFAYGFAGVSAGQMDANAGGYGIFGTNIGVGAEVAVNDKFSVGAEYIQRNMTGNDEWITNGTVALRGVFKF